MFVDQYEKIVKPSTKKIFEKYIINDPGYAEMVKIHEVDNLLNIQCNDYEVYTTDDFLNISEKESSRLNLILKSLIKLHEADHGQI